MQWATVIRDVTVRAGDPPRLAEWYARYLGIDLMHEEAEQALPSRAPPSTPTIRLLPADPAQHPGNWSVTLAVVDLLAMRDQLRAAGIGVSPEQRTRRGSYVDLEDPEGHAIRLWEIPATHGRAQSSDEAAVRVIGSDDADEQPLPAHGGRGRGHWVKWAPLALVLIAAVAAVVIIEPGAKSPQSTGPSATTVTGSRAEDGRDEVAEHRAVRVSDVGHPILGISARWELFASGAGSVVHVEFARGRVTTTELPGLSSSGPVSVVVGPDRVLVKPSNSSSGYVIRDGQPPRELRWDQSRAGPLFPGPKSGQVWVTDGSPLAPVLSLRNFDGSPAGVSIEYPAGEFEPLVADARGNVLLDGVGGIYLASPDGLRKVAEGVLLAVGPTHLLLLQCDGQAQCSKVVTNRDTGASHPVPAKCVDCDYPIGAISPDGSMAAVVRPASTYRSTLRVIDLASGDVRHLTQMRGPYYGGAVVWSPDGRWLFTASRGSLLAFDTRTWRGHQLDLALPPVSQVAIRPVEPSTK